MAQRGDLMESLKEKLLAYSLILLVIGALFSVSFVQTTRAGKHEAEKSNVQHPTSNAQH